MYTYLFCFLFFYLQESSSALDNGTPDATENNLPNKEVSKTNSKPLYDKTSDVIDTLKLPNGTDQSSEDKSEENDNNSAKLENTNLNEAESAAVNCQTDEEDTVKSTEMPLSDKIAEKSESKLVNNGTQEETEKSTTPETNQNKSEMLDNRPETENNEAKGNECKENNESEQSSKETSSVKSEEDKMPIKEPDKTLTGVVEIPAIESKDDCLVENNLELSDKESQEKEAGTDVNDEKAGNENIVEEYSDQDSKLETNENSVEENTQTVSENGEQTDSTGPPSLIKEVETDDNSVTSECRRNKEPMDISEQVQNTDKDNDKNKNSCVSASDLSGTHIKSENEKSTFEESDAVQNECTELKGSAAVTDLKPSKVEKKQGQKLDQLLSKITQKAESEEKKAPRQAKARKSFASSSSASSATSNSSKPSSNSLTSLTGLTFNVKELEKQGVLDIPKPSKRKAFEPVKIPSPEKMQSSPILSPVRSPIMKKKMLKTKRKKGKRLGGYRLPGEKSHKKSSKSRKTDSEDRDSVKSDKSRSRTPERGNEYNSELTNSTDLNVSLQSETSFNTSMPDNSEISQYIDNTGKQKSELSPDSLNAFKMITKNAKKSFASTPAPVYKKAKKTVKQGIDPVTHRTLESFLLSGSHSQVVSPGGRKVNVQTLCKLLNFPVLCLYIRIKIMQPCQFL